MILPERVLVRLGPHELQERSDELAQSVYKLSELRRRMAEVAEDFKASQKQAQSEVLSLEGRMFELGTTIRTGQEWRDAQQELPMVGLPPVTGKPGRKSIGKKPPEAGL